MISSSYELDAKKFISDLRKIKNAPRYAVGFEHTIKAIEYAVDVVSGRIERSKLIIQSLENSLNDILYRQSEEKYNSIRSKLKRLVFLSKRSDTSKASGAVRKHT